MNHGLYIPINFLDITFFNFLAIFFDKPIANIFLINVRRVILDIAVNYKMNITSMNIIVLYICHCIAKDKLHYLR